MTEMSRKSICSQSMESAERKDVKKVVFDEAEAADYLGIAQSTLKKSRIEGVRKGRIEPPPYVRLGRAITYRKNDLDSYLDRHRVTPAAPSEPVRRT